MAVHHMLFPERGLMATGRKLPPGFQLNQCLWDKSGLNIDLSRSQKEPAPLFGYIAKISANESKEQNKHTASTYQKSQQPVGMSPATYCSVPGRAEERSPSKHPFAKQRAARLARPAALLMALRSNPEAEPQAVFLRAQTTEALPTATPGYSFSFTGTVNSGDRVASNGSRGLCYCSPFLEGASPPSLAAEAVVRHH